jgi:hypothetical protein
MLKKGHGNTPTFYPHTQDTQLLDIRIGVGRESTGHTSDQKNNNNKRDPTAIFVVVLDVIAHVSDNTHINGFFFSFF